MQFIIDRIEGNHAVCELESKKMISVPLAFFGTEVREGQMYRLSLLREETIERKATISKRFQSLKKGQKEV